LLKVGNQRPIELTDIESLSKTETTEFQKQEMKNICEKYLSNKNDKRALLKALYRRFLPEIIVLFFVGFVATLMDFSGAVFIKLLENFLDPKSDQPYWRGFALVAYMLLSKIVQAIANNHYRFNVSVLGIHIKAGLSSFIFEKALSISPQLLSSGEQKNSANFTYAQIVNLMQVDLERIAMGIPYSMRAITWPIQWIIGIYLLYSTMGWEGGTAGIILMAILFGINIVIARTMAKLQKIVMEKKDTRMKLCNELLANIKVFKLYNWEKKIAERVKNARAVEIGFIRKGLTWMMWVIFLNWGTRNYLIMGVLITMTLSGIVLTPGDIFAGIAVIQILNMSIRLIPDIISNFLNMLVSLKRIQDYLQCREIISYNDSAQGELHPDLAIGMNTASFAWELPEENTTGELKESKAVLKDLSLEIKHGEFVAIVGRVGSGKSSVLQALIQNMNFVRTAEFSNMFINGSVSYVSQEAWIQNTTIKNNILFGSQVNENRYQEVLNVCQLRKDLEILPGGDLTEIGERGINLSGGQKIRVSIARAIYSDHDIMLLDDPLSAVDAHVGKEIFQQCFLDFLKGKTRVLVTNNQQFLPFVDRIIVLNQGKIVEIGNYQELLKSDGYFKNEFLVATDHGQLQKAESEEEIVEEKKETTKGTKIIEVEERVTGRISFSVYKTYFEYSGGIKVVILVIFFMLCWQADRMYTDLYLSEWTNQTGKEQEENQTKNILIYSIGSFSVNLFILFRLMTTIFSGLKAARTIFERMMNALLDAPINKFYDVTPTGRILNRLSKDQNTIDTQLLFALNGSIGQIFTVLSIICMCAYIVPWVLVALPIAIYLSMKIQNFYIASSRELMRLESMSRSPIVQHFSETISGANTIRAFAFQEQFIKKNEELVNSNTSIYFQQQACNCWLGITLEFVSDSLLTVSALIIVGFKGLINPGLAGLCLSYAITLPENIYFLIFATSFLENMMVSVERAHQLAQTQGEAPRQRQKDSELKNKHWPHDGAVEFENFQMKYRDDTEIVLRGVTGTVKPKERIGIVGRTGSGKSSLCLALFRIVESYGGKIYVDGVDISEIGLDLLRQKLCVIPQDPTLFQGTLKENLDPFNECKKEDLIESLKLVEIFPDENPADVLEKEVKDNGSNFSLGQRQLICIARAILRHSKIMFLDEATASVDYKTDAIIQDAIRNKFKDCTVLTIAHRINTIMDYDRVIVMDKGKIAEFDTPERLMEKKGIFYSLVVQHKKL